MATWNPDSEMDEESDGDGYDDYYNSYEDSDEESADKNKSDCEFKCMTVEDLKTFLGRYVETLCASVPVKPAFAKLLLHTHGWMTDEIIASYRQDASKLLIDSRIKPAEPREVDAQAIRSSMSLSCSICFEAFSGEDFHGLSCDHYFCKDCWCSHFEIQIFQGITTAMECMGQDCSLLVPEDFVFSILNKSSVREKYQVFSLSDYVKSHPYLRFCPGPTCDLIIFAKEYRNKCVICEQCKMAFCFKCGSDYHAPTDCETIKKWLTKCADDSETANYISAHTKDCPKCNFCIEKNGGCNHMQCSGCGFHFCWLCLKDWNAHGIAFYDCSRYVEDQKSDNGSAQARESLKKYLFYYERWENHARSLRLEEQTVQKIKDRINAKVMANEGTWIDWQYLINAAALLAKCRYTLQYTYPYAYYMKKGPRKQLFEYQQAQLEAEIENLSWKVERAETTDRGDLENQMDVSEKRRETLVKDFLEERYVNFEEADVFVDAVSELLPVHDVLPLAPGTVHRIVNFDFFDDLAARHRDLPVAHETMGRIVDFDFFDDLAARHRDLPVAPETVRIVDFNTMVDDPAVRTEDRYPSPRISNPSVALNHPRVLNDPEAQNRPTELNPAGVFNHDIPFETFPVADLNMWYQ